MNVDKLGEAIKQTFSEKLPEGAYFVEDDGGIFRLVQTKWGMRHVAYIVKIQGTGILYQPISLRTTDLTSLDTIYRKVMEAITAFRAALLAGTAKKTEDGGLLELDPEEADEDATVPLSSGEEESGRHE